MKKFRQFVAGKKTLTPFELKNGVATHFDHGEGMKRPRSLTPFEKEHGIAVHFSHGEDSRRLPKKIHEDEERSPIEMYDLHTKYLAHHKPNEHFLWPHEKEGTFGSDHISKIVEKIQKHYPIESLSHSAKIHMRRYSESSRDLNHALFESHKKGLPKESPEDIPAHHSLEHMDEATNHHTLRHNLTVFSGVRPEVLTHVASHPERKVYHPAFVSTSLNPITAMGFAKRENHEQHVLKINLKPGHKMLPILNHSAYDSEREVLLPRAQSFHIHKTPKIYHIAEWNHPTKMHVWDTDVIQHHEK